jgi:hypothetical protein
MSTHTIQLIVVQKDSSSEIKKIVSLAIVLHLMSGSLKIVYLLHLLND